MGILKFNKKSLIKFGQRTVTHSWNNNMSKKWYTYRIYISAGILAL